MTPAAGAGADTAQRIPISARSSGQNWCSASARRATGKTWLALGRPHNCSNARKRSIILCAAAVEDAEAARLPARRFSVPPEKSILTWADLRRAVRPVDADASARCRPAKFEIAPLAFCAAAHDQRAIILDDAQNPTAMQMKIS